MAEDFDISLKIIVVGNGGVGKTSLIQRFCKGAYTDVYKKTIGVDFLEKDGFFVPAAGESVKMMLWDTAGQEEFDGITKNYYKGAAGAVLAFSTTDADSLKALESWKTKVEAQCGPICMAIMQNKVDLLSEAKVTQKEVEDAATRVKAKLYRVSVKDNLNVNDLFEYLASECIRVKKSGGGPQEQAVHTTTTKEQGDKTVAEQPFRVTDETAEAAANPKKKKKSGCSLL
eukprot:m51a1_g11815 putative ras-related protein rab-23 (229) ;mRNA; r:391834-392837